MKRLSKTFKAIALTTAVMFAGSMFVGCSGGPMDPRPTDDPTTEGPETPGTPTEPTTPTTPTDPTVPATPMKVTLSKVAPTFNAASSRSAASDEITIAPRKVTLGWDYYGVPFDTYYYDFDAAKMPEGSTISFNGELDAYGKVKDRVELRYSVTTNKLTFNIDKAQFSMTCFKTEDMEATINITGIPHKDNGYYSINFAALPSTKIVHEQNPNAPFANSSTTSNDAIPLFEHAGYIPGSNLTYGPTLSKVVLNMPRHSNIFITGAGKLRFK